MLICKNQNLKNDYILYFLGYRMEFFSFLNTLKNLDPSYKMDLVLWDCYGRVKFVYSKISYNYLVICSHSKEGTTPSYS